MLGTLLSLVLSLNPYITLISSVLPDAEFIFGLEHRAVFHNVFALLALWLLLRVRSKRLGLSFLVGYSSHLVLDLFSYTGVKLFYPLLDFEFFIPFDSERFAPFVFVGLFVFAFNYRRFSSPLSSKCLYAATLAAFVFLPLLAKTRTACDTVQPFPVASLLSNQGSFSERQVLVRGTVCSSVEEKTYKSGSTYSIFDVCEGDARIVVWVKSPVSIPNQGDGVSVCGTFTTRYKEPEIYYVKKVF